MKTIILTSIAVTVFGLPTFGRGVIVFENADSSTQPAITLSGGGVPPGTASGSGLVVELFWNNGLSYVLEDIYTSTFNTADPLNGPGYFSAGDVTIPVAGTQSFEVEGFYTYDGLRYTGTTAPFTAKVNSLPIPPISLDSGTWNGDMVL